MKIFLAVLLLVSLALLAGSAVAQAPDAAQAPAAAPAPTPAQAPDAAQAPAAAPAPAAEPSHNRFTIGVAARASTLGFGADAAIPVLRHANVRVGFSLFDYNLTLTKDNNPYGGSFNLRSVQTLFDFFPLGANFHLSPGLLIYNGNTINANASIVSKNSLTLNNDSYVSQGSLNAGLKVKTNSVAPMFLIGWGNLVPRSNRHLVFSVEGGFVYQGSPNATLNVTGSACVNGKCGAVANLPNLQSDIQAEQSKLNNDISFVQFYPVISVSFGYKF